MNVFKGTSGLLVFFGYKTGSRHFQDTFPNIFLIKSTFARRMRGLSTISGVLPVLSIFPVIKPEVRIFLSYFVFFSKYTRKVPSNEL